MNISNLTKTSYAEAGIKRKNLTPLEQILRLLERSKEKVVNQIGYKFDDQPCKGNR